MHLYEKFVLPTLLDAACGMASISAQREKVVPLCSGVVLEVGVGGGLNFPLYNPKQIDRLFALEPATEMIRMARARAEDLPFSVVFLKQGAEKISLSDNSIDTVLCTYTLCTIPRPDEAIKEIRRVLRPSGTFVFCEHGLSEDEQVAHWQHRINGCWRYLVGGCNLNRNIPALIRNGGFQIEHLEKGYLPSTPKFVGYNYWGVAV